MKGCYAPLQHESIDKILAVFHSKSSGNQISAWGPTLFSKISPGSNSQKVLRNIKLTPSPGNQKKQEVASPQQPSEHQ